MSSDAFAAQKVVLTGGGGFLGSWVREALAARGVTRVEAPRKKDYDLVQPGAAQRLLTDTRPDLVIHLAAVVGGIGANRANPGRFFYENLMMGAQLIEEARRYGLKKLVVVGTVCAYPNRTPVPFSEDDLWNGYPEPTNAPYGVAKKALLVQAQAYRAQYGLDTIYLLPANLYGPRDNFDPAVSHVIPALIKKFVDAREAGESTVTCWGDGSPSREFLHAADAARGLVLAAERYGGADPVNLGTGREVTIADLAAQVAKACRFTGKIAWDGSQPNGQPRRRLDTSRAEKLFGFKAEVPFEQGLADTVRWYEERVRT